jgi:hypothetical protein
MMAYFSFLFLFARNTQRGSLDSPRLSLFLLQVYLSALVFGHGGPTVNKVLGMDWYSCSPRSRGTAPP